MQNRVSKLGQDFLHVFNEYLLHPNYISVTSHSSVNKAGYRFHSSWAWILRISSALALLCVQEAARTSLMRLGSRAWGSTNEPVLSSTYAKTGEP